VVLPSGYTENGEKCQQQDFIHGKLFRNNKVGLFLIKISLALTWLKVLSNFHVVNK
jgi:hypothetical protein